MSKTYIHGSEIVFDNPDESQAQIVLKSKDKIQFNIGGNDVFEITSNGATIEQTGSDLTIDDVLTVEGTTDSTSPSTGSIICAGGVGIAKDVSIGGGELNMKTPFDSDKTITVRSNNGYNATLRLDEGDSNGSILNYNSSSNRLEFIGVNGGTETISAFLNKNNSQFSFLKPVNITDTTETTSASTGALICDGGVGVAKSLYVGVDIDYVGVLTDVSDKRIKTNIKPVGKALEKVMALNPCTFDIKLNDCSKKKSGFIAQELEILFPELVVQKPTEVDGKIIEDFRRIKETEMIPYLVKAIQELGKKQDNPPVPTLNDELIKSYEERIKNLEEREPFEVSQEAPVVPLDNELIKSYEDRIKNLEQMNQEKTQKIAELNADVSKLDKNTKKLNLNLVKLLKRVEKIEAQSETNSSIQDF